MSESQLLGMVDSLEALILDGKKIPFTDNLIIDEKRVLLIVQRLRTAIKDGGNFISDDPPPKPVVKVEPVETNIDLDKVIKEAEKIKDGADDYADNVLAQLLLLVTKLQKNLVSMERTLENGRKMVQKGDTTHEENR